MYLFVYKTRNLIHYNVFIIIHTNVHTQHNFVNNVIESRWSPNVIVFANSTVVIQYVNVPYPLLMKNTCLVMVDGLYAD